MTKQYLLSLFIICISVSFLNAQSKVEQRLEKSIQIMEDFLDLPNKDIPEAFMDEAEAIILVPKLIKIGIGVGGKHGKGIALIRDRDGDWSNPIFVKISGVSVGCQLGFQSSEYVLILQDKSMLEDLDGDQFTLGGDIAGTFFKEGRHASTSTDFKSDGGMFAYSRSKGLFAGISLEGAAVSLDKRSTNKYYSMEVDEAEDIYEGNISLTAEVKELHKVLSYID